MTALLVAESATGGMVSVVDTLVDFTFLGDEVVYEVVEQQSAADDLVLSQQGGFRYTSSDRTDFSTHDIHSFEDMISDGAVSPMSFSIGRRSASTGSTEDHLNGVIESMHAQTGGARFDFLADNGTVTGPHASEYSGRGMYVTVAGIDSTEWQNLYRRLSNPVAAQDKVGDGAVSGEGGVPVPASAPTSLLLMVAGVLFAYLMRNRRAARFSRQAQVRDLA